MKRWQGVLLMLAFSPAYVAVIYFGGHQPLFTAIVLGVFASLIPTALLVVIGGAS